MKTFCLTWKRGDRSCQVGNLQSKVAYVHGRVAGLNRTSTVPYGQYRNDSPPHPARGLRALGAGPSCNSPACSLGSGRIARGRFSSGCLLTKIMKLKFEMDLGTHKTTSCIIRGHQHSQHTQHPALNETLTHQRGAHAVHDPQREGASSPNRLSGRGDARPCKLYLRSR